MRLSVRYNMITKYRNWIIGVFAALALGSVISLFFLKFSFNFEDFFPQGDPDLQFFERFKEKFEADDNFLLIAIENEEGVFEQDFLEKFDSLGKLIKPLEEIVDVQYQGDDLEIGFNVAYLIDVLNALGSDGVKVSLSDSNASALIEDDADDAALYVIMPMRL